MLEQNLFYAIVLFQIGIGSIWLPKRLIAIGEGIIKNYPKSQYPKLYPNGIDESSIEKRKMALKYCANCGLAFGLFTIAYSAWNQFPDLLNWDDQAVSMLLYVLQILPLILFSVIAPLCIRIKKTHTKSSIRKAQLVPRNLFTFVQPFLVAVTLLALVTYFTLLSIIAQDPFPGFAGILPNTLGVLAINAAFAGYVFRLIYGKSGRSNLSADDQFRRTSLNTRLMFLGSLAVSLFLSLSLCLSWFDLKIWGPIFQSAFFIFMLLLITNNTERASDIDYSVYQ